MDVGLKKFLVMVLFWLGLAVVVMTFIIAAYTWMDEKKRVVNKATAGCREYCDAHMFPYYSTEGDICVQNCLNVLEEKGELNPWTRVE